MENSTTTDDDSAQTARSTRRQLMGARLKLDTISTEQPQFGELLAQSLDVVRRALSEFGDHPGGGNLAISFNGGKDACVVLYLLLLVLAERDELGRLWKTSGGKRIRVVYFEKEEFPQIDEFMRDVSQTYGFEFLRYAASYKDGTQDLVDSHDVKAFIMGQRRGDPWTETMKWFTPSTPGWAEFTRVNPALEWKFCDVWRFLRASGLPYCVLYDQGYTSLGERGDTAKNEALRLPNGEYRPAYELAEEEEHLERSPRSSTNGDHHDGEKRACDGSSSSSSSNGGVKTTQTNGGGGLLLPAGRADGKPAVLPPVKRHPSWDKKPSSWDKKWSPLDGCDQDGGGSTTNGVSSDGGRGGGGGDDIGVGDGDGARSNGGARRPTVDTTFLGLKKAEAGVVAAGGRNEGVRTRVSERRVIGGGVGSCLQPEEKGHGMSAGWVGGSVRWLPLTFVVTVVLAAVGGRTRSESPREGGGSVAEGGS